MKTNFKPHDKVTITDTKSKFFMCTGELISITTSLNKPLKIDLGLIGQWNFSYEEVQPIHEQRLANEAKIKPHDEPKQKSGIVTQVKDKKAVKQDKIKPTKKTQEIKIKRAYNRKPKTTTE